MATIYLLSPPYHSVYKNADRKNSGVIQPPLGLAYIASYLQSRGHCVKLFDSSFSKDIFYDIRSHMQEFHPTFVGITATTPQIPSAFQIAEYTKSIDPSVKVILGGFHASALPEETLSSYVDIVVCGEGEITMAEIVEGKDLCIIQGICFKQGGRVVMNPQRPLTEDLDLLPMPLWEQLPVKSYYYVPEKTIGVLSGRGCPYQCTYCASGVIGRHRYRKRSPLNLVNELEGLYRYFGVKNVMFVDETFTIDQKRVEEISHAIIERKLPLKWTCDTRVDCVTKDMLKTMKAAGCKTLRVGIESADEIVLKAANRSVDLEQARAVVSWAKELNIRTVAYYLLGLPYETMESLEKTLIFAKALKTDLAHFSMLVPLPGTSVWDIVSEGKILRCTAKEWSEYTKFDQAIVESDTLTKEQLEEYHKFMIRSYFLRYSYILQTLRSIKSFTDLKDCMNNLATFLKMFFGRE